MEEGYNEIHWSHTPPKDISQSAIPEKYCWPLLLRDNSTKLIKGVRLRWKIRLTSTNQEQILSYIAEDDYKIYTKPSPKALTTMIKDSYARFCAEFYIKAASEGLEYQPPSLQQIDYDIILKELSGLLP